jgi:Flp pilus assembly protein TadB
MVSLGALWLPVLLSAVLVFLTSFLIHMVLRYHTSDYKPLPNEEAVRAAIRSGNPPPAQYIIPYCANPKDMRAPDMQRKFVEGPVAVLNLKRPGPPGMGTNLIQWFIFTLVLSFFVAYVACHTIQPGTPYLEVFRVVGAVAFLAYAFGQFPAAIWMGKPWSVAWKEGFDGLLYGLVTAGTFGWLWPR